MLWERWCVPTGDRIVSVYSIAFLLGKRVERCRGTALSRAAAVVTLDLYRSYRGTILYVCDDA